MLETGYGLRKLGVMVMQSALKILQLRQARDGTADIQLEEVFNQEEQDALSKILPKLQGETVSLKNPHPEGQLSWAAWIIARLGGWKGYRSSSPPGMKTYKRGLDRFNAMVWAWHIDSG